MGWFLPALAGAGLNMLGNFLGNRAQERTNIRLSDRQYAQNMEMLKYQNEYNSPASQMARFQEAGLNPNLIYGQGTSGNMTSAPQYDIAPVNVQNAYADLGTKFQQMRLMASQADLTETKVNESGVKQDLMQAQKDLIRANPYLNESYVSAMVTQLQSAARLKEQEANIMTSKEWFIKPGGELEYSSYGFQKVTRELDLLSQKFNLGQADQKIKAQILESKEFQNELQRIQVEWMKNGEVTPQHIYQGIMLLLGKLMR